MLSERKGLTSLLQESVSCSIKSPFWRHTSGGTFDKATAMCDTMERGSQCVIVIT